MATRYKIQKMGAQVEHFVNRLRAEGNGYRAIAHQIKEVFGVDLSHTAVKNYLKNGASERMKLLGEESMKKVEQQKMKKILKVENQLQELNKKLKRALNSLDETNRADMKLLKDLAKEIREQLKFHKRFIEQVTEPTTQINLNKTQIAIKVSKELSRLEEEGIIKIKKPQEISLHEDAT